MYFRIILVAVAIALATYVFSGAADISHADTLRSRAFVTGSFECDVKFEDWGDELTLEQCVIDDVEFSTD